MRIQKPFKNSLKKVQRKSPTTSTRARKLARKRVVHARSCSNSSKRRSFVKCSSKQQQQVSDKLEALRSLIPHRVQNGGSDDEMVKAEQLFQETADYIIVLKTQVFVLEKLIEFYDGSKNVKQNAQEESSS